MYLIKISEAPYFIHNTCFLFSLIYIHFSQMPYCFSSTFNCLSAFFGGNVICDSSYILLTRPAWLILQWRLAFLYWYFGLFSFLCHFWHLSESIATFRHFLVSNEMTVTTPLCDTWSRLCQVPSREIPH
jgi:hypothetical protein